MALTNILREPRKELTEQAVGFTVFVGAVLLVASLATIMCLIADGTVWVSTSEFAAASYFALIAVLVGTGMLFMMHAVGEAVCKKFRN